MSDDLLKKQRSIQPNSHPPNSTHKDIRNETISSPQKQTRPSHTPSPSCVTPSSLMLQQKIDEAKGKVITVDEPSVLNDETFNDAHYTADDDYVKEEKPRKVLNPAKKTKKTKQSKKATKSDKVDLSPQQQQPQLDAKIEISVTENVNSSSEKDILKDEQFNDAHYAPDDDKIVPEIKTKRKALNPPKKKKVVEKVGKDEKKSSVIPTDFTKTEKNVVNSTIKEPIDKCSEEHKTTRKPLNLKFATKKKSAESSLSVEPINESVPKHSEETKVVLPTPEKISMDDKNILIDENFNNAHQPTTDDTYGKGTEKTTRKTLNPKKASRRLSNKNIDDNTKMTASESGRRKSIKRVDTGKDKPVSKLRMYKDNGSKTENVTSDSSDTGENSPLARRTVSPRGMNGSSHMSTVSMANLPHDTHQIFASSAETPFLDDGEKSPKNRSRSPSTHEGEDPMVTKVLIIQEEDRKLVFNIADTIGRGAFGEVLKGMNADSGEFVAIKQMKVNKKSVLKEVAEEIKLLRFLENDYIVRYIASTQSHGCLYIVMEFMESGSLLNIVKQFKQLNEVLSAKYIYQVLIGLEYIHGQGIVHRDIKAANILVAKDGRVKIADFGVSIQTSDLSNGNSEDPIGTPNWMSPEVIQMQGTTIKADIWALGCTVIELITGNAPYSDLNPTAALYRIVSDEHPPFPPSVSPYLRQFLLACFDRDINLRKTAKELKSFKWITQNCNEKKAVTTKKKVVKKKVEIVPQKKDDEDWGNDFATEGEDDILKNIPLVGSQRKLKPVSFDSDFTFSPAHSKKATPNDNWDDAFISTPVTKSEKIDNKDKVDIFEKLEKSQQIEKVEKSGNEKLKVSISESPQKVTKLSLAPIKVVEESDWDGDFAMDSPSQPKVTLNTPTKETHHADKAEKKFSQSLNTSKGDDDWGDLLDFPADDGKQTPIFLRPANSPEKKPIAFSPLQNCVEDYDSDFAEADDKPTNSVSAMESIEAMECFELETTNQVSQMKSKYRELILESIEVLNSGAKDVVNKMKRMMNEINTVCQDDQFSDIDTTISECGVFPILSVLEQEEFDASPELRLEAIKVINVIMDKCVCPTDKNIEGCSPQDNCSKARELILMTGGATVVNYCISMAKHDLHLVEIVKFLKNVFGDVGNKFLIPNLFINCGGLSIISQILSPKIEVKDTLIDEVLKTVYSFVEKQANDVSSKKSMCPKNILILMFLQDKVMDAIIQYACRMFLNKNYEGSLDGFRIVNQLISSNLISDLQIKAEMCQRVITNNVFGLLKKLDSSKDANFVQEEILFNICKLCKNLLTKIRPENFESLLNAKIVPFLVKLMSKCDSLDNPIERDKPHLTDMMKTGLINNMFQCIWLCLSFSGKNLAQSVFKDMMLFTSTFTLLRSYCEVSLKASKSVENDTVKIIIIMATMLNSHYKTCDFITGEASLFLIKYFADGKHQFMENTFNACIAMYLSNPKKVMKTFTSEDFMKNLMNALKNANYDDQVCVNELLKFKTLTEYTEVAQNFAQSFLLLDLVKLLRDVTTNNREVKINLLKIVKSLLQAHPEKKRLVGNVELLAAMKQVYENGVKENMVTVREGSEECIKMLTTVQLESKPVTSIRSKFFEKKTSSAHKRSASSYTNKDIKSFENDTKPIPLSQFVNTPQSKSDSIRVEAPNSPRTPGRSIPIKSKGGRSSLSKGETIDNDKKDKKDGSSSPQSETPKEKKRGMFSFMKK
ncbi:cell division control protein 15, CDC15, putative [Entamoeba invadens IP1]|uniref:non-specific serine/threonine protein kinase n=1 Tax=Entamoeba invadens IP1 TaxID=370355 RepID=A0A0A1U727_ENTIV|nr:cell division control protein 15, CDC15, putative [Entamoeba invadens IP1]ELP90125.1 cell division control protein 15, CDC15, putative [Entamoeba invadens IP1]|eukprot:XP_004256896.1 cell division control protein 15, CDC15, putative [Entamoeba invadens IP1]